MKKLISKINLMAACFALLTVFSGCSKEKDLYDGHPILGAWSYNALGVFTEYYTFKANGTGTYEMIWSSLSSLNLERSFNWTINGTRVTITNTGSSTTSIATEIFFDSRDNTFYDIRYPNLHFTKHRR